MSFTLPDLPYPKKALEPHISEQTLNYHYGKHHKAYVDKLNGLVENSPFQKASLEQVITESQKGPLLNNAAQVWNHTFYWHCLSPSGGGEPPKELADTLCTHFGSVESFKESFTKTALAHFGSGWAWLVKTSSNKLEITSTSNADNPLSRKGIKPLLTCDVWEHAYYIDYKNARPDYLKAFWKLINWEFLQKNLQSHS